MEEEWRVVVGYEGCYEVSGLGRIRSARNKTNTTRNKILRLNPDKDGYLLFTLCRNNVKSAGKVHQIVARAFIGDRPAGFVVNHKDGNKANNRPSNLEYISQRDNQIHAFTLGLRTPLQGERQPHAKLTEDDVREIRRLAGKLTQKEIASRFPVTDRTVGEIIRGEIWRHIL